MIFGLTGTNGAGKGTVAELLGNRGYVYFSLSDALRDSLTDQGLEHSRDNLTAEGNRLRAAQGPGVLGLLTVNKLSGLDKAAVDSIRNPAEIEALRQGCPQFLLLSVEATPEVRLARLKARNRPGDSISDEAFWAQEKKESQDADPTRQRLAACAALADHRLDNNGTLDDLESNLEALLNRLTSTP